jgi:hypothetical protein
MKRRRRRNLERKKEKIEGVFVGYIVDFDWKF